MTCKHINTERLAAPGAGNYSPCHEYCKDCGAKRYWPSGMSTQMLYGPPDYEGKWPQPKWELIKPKRAKGKR